MLARMLLAALAAALSLPMAACTSVTLDLTDLEHPVLLNDSVFVGPDPPFDHVDAYSASVETRTSRMIMIYGGGKQRTYHEQRKDVRVDDAQAAAYEAIGGKLHHAIHGVRIRAHATCHNLILAYGQQVEIEVQGKVVRYRFPFAGEDTSAGGPPPTLD